MNLLAAANPEGEFVGIDAIEGHVRHARSVARAARLSNVRFLHCTFEQALARRFKAFDYVFAHGVYTWVSDTNADRLFELARRFLKPGGLYAMGYNVEPGWSSLRPVQRLLFELGQRECTHDQGPAITRALQRLSELTRAGARALSLPPHAARIVEMLPGLPVSYLTHEYLNSAWRPVFVTEAHARARQHGLEFVASANVETRRMDFVLRSEAREIVAAQEDPVLREFLIDLCLNRSFRSDVFTREGRRLPRARTRSRRLAGRYALLRPRRGLDYTLHTAAGRLRFDNRAARALTRALEASPCRLADVAARVPGLRCSEADLLNVADALLAARIIAPVDPRKRVQPVPLNDLLRRRIDSGDGLNVQVGSHGTAFAVPMLDQILIHLNLHGRPTRGALAAYLDAHDLEMDEAGSQDFLKTALAGWTARRRIYETLGVM